VIHQNRSAHGKKNYIPGKLKLEHEFGL
jgi:hypothetical protein